MMEREPTFIDDLEEAIAWSHRGECLLPMNLNGDNKDEVVSVLLIDDIAQSTCSTHDKPYITGWLQLIIQDVLKRWFASFKRTPTKLCVTESGKQSQTRSDLFAVPIQQLLYLGNTSTMLIMGNQVVQDHKISNYPDKHPLQDFATFTKIIFQKLVETQDVYSITMDETYDTHEKMFHNTVALTDNQWFEMPDRYQIRPHRKYFFRLTKYRSWLLSIEKEGSGLGSFLECFGSDDAELTSHDRSLRPHDITFTDDRGGIQIFHTWFLHLCTAFFNASPNPNLLCSIKHTVVIGNSDDLRYYQMIWPAVCKALKLQHDWTTLGIRNCSGRERDSRLGLSESIALVPYEYNSIDSPTDEATTSNEQPKQCSQDPTDLLQMHFSSSIFRFHVGYWFVQNQFAKRINFRRDIDATIAELANGIGNLFHRIFGLAKKLSNKSMPDAPLIYIEQQSSALWKMPLRKCLDAFINAMHSLNLRRYCILLLSASRRVNRYLASASPWSIREDFDLRNAVMRVAFAGSYFISIMLEPICPAATKQLDESLFEKIPRPSIGDLLTSSWSELLPPGKIDMTEMRGCLFPKKKESFQETIREGKLNPQCFREPSQPSYRSSVDSPPGFGGSYLPDQFTATATTVTTATLSPMEPLWASSTRPMGSTAVSPAVAVEPPVYPSPVFVPTGLGDPLYRCEATGSFGGSYTDNGQHPGNIATVPFSSSLPSLSPPPELNVHSGLTKSMMASPMVQRHSSTRNCPTGHNGARGVQSVSSMGPDMYLQHPGSNMAMHMSPVINQVGATHHMSWIPHR